MIKIIYAIACLVILFACGTKEDLVVTAISLDEKELTLKVGERYKFKVTHTPNDVDAPQYIWNVPNIHLGDYDGAVVTVDQDGNVQAIHEGEVDLIVEVFYPDNNLDITANCKITVEPIDAKVVNP